MNKECSIDIFGYENIDGRLLTLEQIAISATPATLLNFAQFLIECANEMIKDNEFEHRHFLDFMDHDDDDVPDIIVSLKKDTFKESLGSLQNSFPLKNNSEMPTQQNVMHYFMTYKKAVGCPYYLDTLLHETLELSVQEGSMLYPWNDYSLGGSLAALPKELWMIAKTKKYNFDIKSDFRGFIVSNLFLDLMSNYNVGTWEKAKLHVQLKAGKSVSEKQYFFMRQDDKDKLMASDVVDIEKSDLQIRYDGTVRRMRSLVFTDQQTMDLFMLRGKDEYLFCSEKFANACKEIKIKGVDFMPVDKLKFEGMELI